MNKARTISQAAGAAVAAIAILIPTTVANARGNPGAGGGGGGRPPNAGTETVGNNLSNPAIFAEGVGITGLLPSAADQGLPPWQQAWTGLRIPSPTNPTLAVGPDGIYTSGGVTYYLQGTEQSSWQAGWINGGSATSWPANVKWGDNIIGTLLPSSGGSTSWTTTSTIHLEVSMKSTAALTSAAGLDYFPTQALYGSGNTETFGTTGVATAAAGQTPNVYSDAAYLTIQALTSKGGTLVGNPIHVLATWNRTAEGPSTTALTPEVNAGGGIVYSYNWFAGRDHLTPGWYRITFGIAGSAGSPAGTPTTAGKASITGVIGPSPTEGGAGTPVTCGSPVQVNDESGNPVTVPMGCSTAGNYSSVDIQLISGSTGGGGGAGHGGGSGGGGGGGGGHGGGR